MAYGHPLEKGDAVYSARVLLELNLFNSNTNLRLEEGGWRKEYAALYPNPTDGFVTLNYTMLSDAAMRLLDANGRVLMEAVLDHAKTERRFDLSGLSAGVYLLEVHGTDALLREKIVLVR